MIDRANFNGPWAPQHAGSACQWARDCDPAEYTLKLRACCFDRIYCTACHAPALSHYGRKCLYGPGRIVEIYNGMYPSQDLQTSYAHNIWSLLLCVHSALDEGLHL